MTNPTRLREPRLVPVIELEPAAFSAEDRPRPPALGDDSPDAWGRFWLDCLSDSGVRGLAPLKPNSWHVPIHALGDRDTLARIIRVLGPTVPDDATSEDVDDATGPLIGGLALLEGDEVLVAPTCCSDLGNLSGWREAAVGERPSWQMLWIGHPWLSARSEGGTVILSGPHESAPPTPRWAVDARSLARALDEAEVIIGRFARSLEGILADQVPARHVARVARRLAGLPDRGPEGG